MQPSWEICLLSVFLLVFLVFIGLHVAFSLLFSGMVGMYFIGGPQMLGAQLGSVSYSTAASYGYIVIPLFVLMGQFAAEGGIGEDAFRAARLWIGRVRGGLAMATVLGCGAFGAASGSTASSAALFSKIAFPEMVRHGYNRSLAAGCIAAGGTVASMIPPSILLVLFGIVGELSIGKLLVAGILPGLLEIASYIIVIYISVRLYPDLAPVLSERVPWRDRFISTRGVMPIGIVFAVAIGGIFFGVFTPSEGGAMGAAGALIVVLMMRRLSFNAFVLSLKESALVTGMIFLAVIGGFLFSRMLVLGGVVEQVTTFILSLPISPHLTFLCICALLIILGMVMQSIVIMLITVPILLPPLQALGYDPIWFAIIFVRLSEVAVITPPVAVNLYVVKGVLGNQITLWEIFRGTGVFIAADIVNLILLYMFPQIVLWLPGIM
jgi:C4-dicarboxylate transporter, DctM subunit